MNERAAISDTAAVDVHASLEAPCAADRLFALVDDLARYPAWMGLVHRVEPFAEADDGAMQAWQVELRARVGPLARSKRLRMHRTVHDPVARRVVFERAEADGRRHSAWVLRAEVFDNDNDNDNADDSANAGSTLHMHLYYGGALWTGGVLERVLADQIKNGRERLVALTRSTH